MTKPLSTHANTAARACAELPQPMASNSARQSAPVARAASGADGLTRMRVSSVSCDACATTVPASAPRSVARRSRLPSTFADGAACLMNADTACSHRARRPAALRALLAMVGGAPLFPTSTLARPRASSCGCDAKVSSTKATPWGQNGALCVRRGTSTNSDNNSGSVDMVTAVKSHLLVHSAACAAANQVRSLPRRY